MEGWFGTCSIEHPIAYYVTFARSAKYLEKLKEWNKPLGAFVPEGTKCDLPKEIVLFPDEYFEYRFTLFHNAVNYRNIPMKNVEGERLQVHPSVIIGDGIRVAVGPGGVKAQLKHMGNVVFGDDVYVGPFTLIQRGTLYSTIIGNGVKIDNHVTVGHNDVIGDNTVMATGTVLGGSVKIGKNCWLGLNCTVRNGVNICDNVSIGMGAVVTKNITEPGIYAGNPAKFIKPLPEGWNF